VSPSRGGGWRMRTYERGVEAETLACGTGAVATAILLNAWGEANDTASIETRSGQMLRVRLSRSDGAWRPSLAGDARIVYRRCADRIPRHAGRPVAILVARAAAASFLRLKWRQPSAPDCFTRSRGPQGKTPFPQFSTSRSLHNTSYTYLKSAVVWLWAAQFYDRRACCTSSSPRRTRASGATLSAHGAEASSSQIFFASAGFPAAISARAFRAM
jgi:hypothetical protein